MPELRKLLTDARALIEEHGWVQFDYGNADKGYCLVGALVAAGRVEGRDVAREEQALRVLRELVGASFLSLWNDAPGRTQIEVLELLQRALDESSNP